MDILLLLLSTGKSKNMLSIILHLQISFQLKLMTSLLQKEGERQIGVNPGSICVLSRCGRRCIDVFVVKVEK
jgi:hypothetical protein